jgi:V8-like Glu-specific endopeptidase
MASIHIVLSVLLSVSMAFAAEKQTCFRSKEELLKKLGSPAASSPSPNSPSSEGQTQEEETPAAEAPSEVDTASGTSARCKKEFEAFVNSCFKIEGYYSHCRTRTAMEASMPHSSDALASGLVDSANCNRRIGLCFRRGDSQYKKGSSNRVSRDDLMHACFDNSDGLYESDSMNKMLRKVGTPDQIAAKDFYHKGIEILDGQAKCLDDVGDSNEAAAIQVVKDSQSARSQDQVGQQAVSCIQSNLLNEEDGGENFRLCEYSTKGGSRFESYSDGETPPLDGANPVYLDKGKYSHCSATLLGDGHSIVTAGHCAGERGEEFPVSVYDKSGNLIKGMAKCHEGVDVWEKADSSLCVLDRQAEASPTYWATIDRSMSGTECKTGSSSYVLVCPNGYFESLTMKKVDYWGYPGSHPISHSTGSAYWNGYAMEHDLLCSAGCSGGGMIIEDGQSRRVLIGGLSTQDRDELNGTVYPTDSKTAQDMFADLKVQSVDKARLEESGLLFAQMSFGSTGGQ